MKITWLSDLDLTFPGPEIDPKGKLAILKQDFTVKIDQIIFLAPQGMITDGASIPRYFWRVIGSPFTGKYRRAAVFHDAAYKGLLEAYDSQNNKIPERLNRKAADGLFLVLMQSDKANWLLRQTIHLAVRIFGRFSWKD